MHAYFLVNLYWLSIYYRYNRLHYACKNASTNKQITADLQSVILLRIGLCPIPACYKIEYFLYEIFRFAKWQTSVMSAKNEDGSINGFDVKKVITILSSLMFCDWFSNEFQHLFCVRLFFSIFFSFFCAYFSASPKAL